ncbi:hypothetical protein DFH09DRAFT_1213914 [Mycena vulgaris]|nr:hypothetical protein DFH09DRAFT_1213914 [Mycena vulgaris]
MATTARISSSEVAAAAQRDMLLFPTKNGGSEERTINGKTQDQLKEMCRDYGRAVSGNKTQLKARLHEYSECFCNDPNSRNLLPVKRRSHKGPQEGPKKSQPKQSANRRAAIIDTERVTERSKDTRTADEMKDLLLWADRTLARLPYKALKPETLLTQSVMPLQGGLVDRSLHDRMQTIESQLAAIAAGPYQGSTRSDWAPASAASFTNYPGDYVVFDHTAASTTSFFSDYDTENTLFDIPNDINWTPTLNLHISPTSDGIHSSSPTLPSTRAAIPTMPAPISCSPTAQIPPTSNAPARSLTLGNHTVITITADEVMKIAVPATSFAENIERLNQMWDDTSPYWKNDSVVKINMCSIALIYWPEIFKKTGLWSAHKSNWTEWKVRFY